MTRADYFKAIEMKTAELFALSCDLGAGLSGASALQRLALRQYGSLLGTAYQVYDDCVDLFGTEAAAGKSLGTDLAKGKLTLPLLLAWERASAADRRKLEKLVETWQTASMPRVSELLTKYETLGPSLEIIEQYLDRARETLRTLPESSGRAGLSGLTEYLTRQTTALGDCV